MISKAFSKRFNPAVFPSVFRFISAMLIIHFSLISSGFAETSVQQADSADITTIENTLPIVLLQTNFGIIKLELNAEKAPISVKNFLTYVNEGFYDGLIFHRVIPNFMIQGGGFSPDLKQKPTKAKIKNEAKNGLKNNKGTIAMARTPMIDSATSQFFINLEDNHNLNHSAGNYGYAVFGKVIEGMEVVNKIANVGTRNQGMHQNVPAKPVMIEKATQVL